MISKFYSKKTLATIALGVFCIGGTTVFAESVAKLSQEDVPAKPQTEEVSQLAVATNAQGSDIASSEPIKFDLQAGWDLQRPQATAEIAKSEAAAAAEAAIAAEQAAQAAQAAQLAAQAAASAPVSVPAASKQTAIVSKAKAKSAATTAVAKATVTAAQPAQDAVQTGQTIQDHQGASHSYKKVLNATASAYSSAPEENGGYGAVDYFGNALALGTIAVDPKVIPLGTTVLIKGYSFSGLPQTLLAKASDIGGAIKGNKIDIFIPGSKSFVNSFGLQKVQIYVLN